MSAPYSPFAAIIRSDNNSGSNHSGGQASALEDAAQQTRAGQQVDHRLAGFAIGEHASFRLARAKFEKMVREFYGRVATDEVLLPIHLEPPDLEGASQCLTSLLEQYWGGPNMNSQERGHPRLRIRHMPFKVSPDVRDRWLHHMRAALDTL